MRRPKKIVGKGATSTASATASWTMRVHRRPPDDHPMYTAIGRVASEWAHLEHILDMVIWELAGLPQAQGSCITAQLNGHAPRFRAILALGKLKGLKQETIEAFEDLLNKTYGIAEKRARIVHDPWYQETGSGQTGQFKSFTFKDARYGIHDVDETEIVKTLSSIRSRIATASKLRAVVLAELAPSP